MKPCTHCQLRPADEPDPFMVRMKLPENNFCSICREAQRIAYTSVDDARHTIQTTNIDVLYMVAKMERAKRSPRASIIQHLNRRFRQLSGLKTDEFQLP